MAYMSTAAVGDAGHDDGGNADSRNTWAAAVQRRIPQRNYLIAAAAIATGAGLAALRWRRIQRESRFEHGLMLHGAMLADVICE